MDTAISPLILQRRKRLALLATAALLLALCASAWGLNHILRPSIDAADIRVATVRRGDIANTINASGIVIPVHEELVTSSIQTRIAKVHAKLGQQVASGELLLELDDHTIKLAIDALREQMAQQENRIGALTLELEQKRKQLASGIELLELDLQSARAKRESYTSLRKAGGVSGENMLAAELNVTRVEIQLRQQKEQIEDARRTTASAVEGARLQKSILQKQLDQQLTLLAKTRVRAPFEGTLSMLASEEGASVAVGQSLARVSEPNNYRVEATLSDFHAQALAAGQPVRIEQDKIRFTGRVQTVLPEIQNGAIQLIVALDQPSHPSLRNKMRVDAYIVSAVKSGALVTDNGAAFNGKGRQPAFLIRDGMARKTVLEIGAGDGKQVEILSGAQPGDRVIVSDIASFRQHDHIRIAH